MVPAAVFGVHDKTETVRRVDFPVPVKIRNWYGGEIKGIDLIYEEKPEKDTDFTDLICAGSSRLFTWSWMQLREDGAVYTSIEDANLPVAYVNILGRRMNELDGFVEDSQKAAGRGDLTLLPADRKLSVTIDKLDSQITGMQYEIRSLDGERLVERTTLDHWEQSGEEVSAELPIQNLLTEESEYRLTIAIATEKHPAIYFYTRVMWQQESRVQEMVDLAVSFSEKTFDYDSARELTTYLETDPNADNSSLGHVTLKSDFSQLTWKGLSMERVSEPEIHLRELQGIIDDRFKVCCK